MARDQETRTNQPKKKQLNEIQWQKKMQETCFGAGLSTILLSTNAQKKNEKEHENYVEGVSFRRPHLCRLSLSLFSTLSHFMHFLMNISDSSNLICFMFIFDLEK